MRLRNTGVDGLETEPTGLKTYQNSGGAAINLAVHLGALAHRAPRLRHGTERRTGAITSTRRSGRGTRRRMRSSGQRMATMVAPLAARGVEVVNCSRQTHCHASRAPTWKRCSREQHGAGIVESRCSREQYAIGVEPAVALHYAQACAGATAMAPHLPRLAALASGCALAVEFGVKRAGSSAALLMGADYVISYDIVPTHEARKLQASCPRRWEYRIGDSRIAPLHPCDLLFIDSLHTYEQMRAELTRHADSVDRYLVCHDTVTFGSIGADGETGRHRWAPSSVGEAVPVEALGIRPAIDELMIRDRSWHIAAHYPESHGLLVLERVMTVFTACSGRRTGSARADRCRACGISCSPTRPLNVPPYQTIPYDVGDIGPRLASRQLKILANHPALEDAEITLWHDAAFQLQCNPLTLAEGALADVRCRRVRHPHRNRIEAEAEVVASLGYMPRDIVRRQVAAYRAAGFTHQNSDYLDWASASGAGRRRSRRGSRRGGTRSQLWGWRDQLSVDYALWKTSRQCEYIAGHYRAQSVCRMARRARAARCACGRHGCLPNFWLLHMALHWAALVAMILTAVLVVYGLRRG